jgi:hypothetical protein
VPFSWSFPPIWRADWETGKKSLQSDSFLAPHLIAPSATAANCTFASADGTERFLVAAEKLLR